MKRPGASARSRRSPRCRSSRSPPMRSPATKRRRGKRAATAMSPSPTARASYWPRSASSCLKKTLYRRGRGGFAEDAEVTENDIGTAIIGAAMRIHSVLGPGLLESAYETCLLYELEKLRLSARRQVLIPIRYEALTVDNGYRVDLLIDNQVVIELKAVEAILPVHRSQLLSYLRLGPFKLGYLLNFHVAHMRDGIVRMLNGF